MFFQVQVNLKGIQMSYITIFHRVFLCAIFPSCGPLYSTYGLSHPSLWHKFFWMYLLMTFKYWTCLDIFFLESGACKMKWWVIKPWYLAKNLGQTNWLQSVRKISIWDECKNILHNSYFEKRKLVSPTRSKLQWNLI